MVLSFDSYTDNGYSAPNTIEFDALDTVILLVQLRTPGWLVAK